MRTLNSFLAISLALCVIATSGLAATPVELASTARQDVSYRSAPGGWTILFYIAADNSAEPRADVSLFQLGQATSGLTDHPTIVATIDRYSTPGTTTLVLAEGTVRESVSAEQDFSDPAVLRAFVETAMRSHPSQYTMLVVVGEGWGWRGICRDNTQPDGASDGLMSVGQLAAALVEAQDSVGRSIDVLTFDADNMAMIEVAYALRGTAYYLVASQAQIQEDGIPYAMILDDLQTRRRMPPRDLARQIPLDHLAYYSPQGNEGIPAFDTSQNFAVMASFDLSKVEEVVSAHSAFADSMIDVLGEVYNEAPHARDLSMVGHFSDIDDYDYLSDIVTFMTVLQDLLPEPIPELDQAIGEYLDAFDEMLIIEVNPDKYHNTHGLSIWYPPSENKYYFWDQGHEVVYGQSFFYEDEDVALDFVPDTSWVEYLKAYYLACSGNIVFGQGEHNGDDY
jgi:hypothetical protein